jgi:hypothetical protein
MRERRGSRLLRARSLSVRTGGGNDVTIRSLWISAALAALLPALPALAHDDPAPNEPAIVVDDWRDNFVPYFDTGDPRTRHDSDPANDESREDPEVRKRQQRWRDEVRPDGSTGEVGDGCTDIDCHVVADQSGKMIQVNQSLSPGPSARGGEPNVVTVDVLGAGARADFGGSETEGPIHAPSNAADPDVQTDTDPEKINRDVPTELHVYKAADHSLLSAAHSPNDHGPGEFDQHDTHGGTASVDVYLPGSENGAPRDSKVGVLILDHLGCQFGCADEYHEFYVADPGRTIFQIGEMPGQTEFVARDPDRWLFGFGPNHETPEMLNPTTTPATDAAFESEAWDAALAVNSSATGVGEANSLCCAAAEPGGPFCNRNAGDGAMNVAESGAVAGCVELSTGDCIGGAVTPDGSVAGCAVVGGQIVYDEEVQEGPDAPAECTRRAVEACCANGACL